MRAALVPATIAWLVGVVGYTLASLWINVFDAHARGASWLNAARPASWPQADFGYLPIVGIAVAVVVFPTCLLVVVPLLKRLPRSSPLWRPGRAALTGALVGPVAMYVWAAGVELQLFALDPLDSNQQGFAAVAALVGMTFGFHYAKAVRTART